MDRIHAPFLIFLLLVTLIIPIAAASNPNFTPVFDSTDDIAHFNQSYTLDPGTSTPWDLWFTAGIIGLVLFGISVAWSMSMSTPYIESAAIMSVVSWVPIGYCAYASFSIDRIAGYGVTGLIESQSANGQINVHEYVIMVTHILYQYPTIGVLMFVFLVVAILNTVRIIALHNVLKGQSEVRND